MKSFMNLKRIFIFIFCAVTFLCAGLYAVNFTEEKSTYAVTNTDDTSTVINIGNLLNDGYEDRIKKINGDALNVLYSSLTGKENATLSDVSSLISVSSRFDATITTGKTLFQNAGNKSIVLTFGGLEWVVTSLTKTRDNQPVATLMLNSQEGLTTKQSQFFVYTNSPSIQQIVTYPRTVYGASYLRVVTLNTGGTYFTSTNSISENISQSEDNDWAIFTMSNELLKNSNKANKSLTDFIVTPANIEYQEIESYTASGGIVNLGNECYGPSTNYKWDYADNYDDASAYPSAAPYAHLWKDDYVWIPSMTELSRSTPAYHEGYWDINPVQFYQGDVTIWTRTGHQAAYGECITLNSTTRPPDGTDVWWDTTPSLNVFPAIHLNLQVAEDYANTNIPTSKVSVKYNGEEYTISKLFSSWYNNETKDYINISPTESITNVGTYNFTVELLSGAEENGIAFKGTDATTATIEVEITKAPLYMNTLQVDEFGKLIKPASSSELSDAEFLILNINGTIYPNDEGKDTTPIFGLQYQKVSGGSWSSNLPTNAGDYYVRAYITNSTTCNYYLESDGKTAFTREKNYIQIPYFYNDNIDFDKNVVGTTTTINYSGINQEFALRNADTGMVGIITGNKSAGLIIAPSTGKYSVAGAGEYWIEVTLADPENTQWSDRSSERKTIKLVVKPAELTVSIDNDSMTSWNKGERNFKILIYVDGIIENEAVKIDAEYGLVSGNNAQYIADNNMVISNGRMTITLDTTNLEINKKYYIDISLKEGVSVNNNYVLINNAEDWEFLLLTSKIKTEDIREVWMYTNESSPSADFTGTNGSVDYNGFAYTVGLNVSYLPSGIDIQYNGTTTETNSNNSTTYNITAVLTPKAGFEFNNGKSSITYQFSWQINPVTCDLSELIWLPDFEYNGKTQKMLVLNLPSWLSNNNYTGNSGKNANNYTAVYTAYLTQYGNHVFINSKNYDNIEIASDGRSATVTHNWEIKKAKIQVSNSADLWIVETIKNKDNEPIDLRKPIAIKTFADQLILKYYKDAGCTEEIEPYDMVLVKEEGSDLTTPTTYYAKVELNPSYANNYELVNVTVSSAKNAILTFNVGGTRAIIYLSMTENVVYNGQSQSDIIKSSIISKDESGNNFDEYNNLVKNGDAGYNIKYYAVIDDEGNYDSSKEVVPRDVGRYVAVIFVADLKPGSVEEGGDGIDIVGSYIVYCHTHYFEIEQLRLTTNWSFTANGNSAIPDEGVSANATGIDLTKFYDYKIYDSTGANLVGTNLDYSSLKFNTKYIARLSLKNVSTNENGIANVVLVDTNDNVVFTNITEFSFTTGRNPNAPINEAILDNPEIIGNTYVVFDGEEHNIEIRIKNTLTSQYIEGADLFDYVTISLKLTTGEISITNISDLLQTQAGVYTYIIRIKDNDNTTWLWDDEKEDKEVAFTIEKKAIATPIWNKTEWEWTGEEINVWATDVDWSKWVIVTGNYTGINIGDGSHVKFELKDKDNTYWGDTALEDKTKTIEFDWEITKVKISGSWVTSNGYIKFVPDNEDKSRYFEVKYLDSDGNKVNLNELVEAKEYTISVTLKSEYDAEHYTFVVDGKEYNTLEMKFSYKKPLGFFEKTWDFIKTNWLIFAIIGGIIFLIILIILFIVKSKKRKKKNEELKVKENTEKIEESETAKLKAELERVKLEKEIAEVKAHQQSFIGPQYIGQMPMGYYQPMQPQYSNEQAERDRKQDQQIQDIRDIVDKLTRFQLATEEEKLRNKSLADAEAILKQSLSNKFKNIPNWLPITIQDLFNHYIEDIYNKAYLPAKESKSKAILLDASPEEQKQFMIETRDFEKNYSSYNKERTDSRYIEMLNEMREKIDKLTEKVEESERKLTEKELNSAKQDIAKNREVIEKNQEEIAKLKQREQEKLIEEREKKSEPQVVQTILPSNNSSQSVKLEFNDAFNMLPAEQKRYFNTLQEYAMNQPKASTRPTKYQFSIGVGIKPYIKFEIKRNTLIAVFGSTEIKIEDDNSVEVAKKMIDDMVKQIQGKN